MKQIEVFISEGDADRRLGTLEFDELRGKEVSSFELDGDFVLHPSVSFLGPDIGLFRGKQYPMLSYGFGLFQDAAPDSWGRKIIRRREKRGNLRESDYLLGVFDLTRVGALRFKVEGSGVFVNADGDNRLGKVEANVQLERIRAAVAKWRDVAVRLGVPRREQEYMSMCFARA